MATEVQGATHTPVEHLGCGYWSEDGGGWRTDGMVLGALEGNPETNNAVALCATFHLSAFASREDSTTPQWNTAELLTGWTILAQVGQGLQGMPRCKFLTTVAHTAYGGIKATCAI